jgi:4'-phosphopantetheinyl transferase
MNAMLAPPPRPRVTAGRCGWLARASAATLGRDAVHVWQFDLRRWTRWHSALAAVLSEEETARINRLRAPAARRELIRAKGLLRHVLARYTRLGAARIRLACSADGKPALDSPALADVQLNIAHAGNRAVIAIALDRAVGVDVEEISPTVHVANLVQQFFTPDESQAFRSLAPDLRRQAFFAAWTRKEAIAKALGRGIGRSPAAFEVSLSPRDPARLLAIDGDPSRAAEWSLADLPGPPGFRQALAVQGPALPVALCQASPLWLLGPAHNSDRN